MYKIASILPANIPIKMAIINMYKTILVSDTISLLGWRMRIELTTTRTTIWSSTIWATVNIGSPGWDRTSDILINSQVFYRWTTEELLILLILIL